MKSPKVTNVIRFSLEPPPPKPKLEELIQSKDSPVEIPIQDRPEWGEIKSMFLKKIERRLENVAVRNGKFDYSIRLSGEVLAPYLIVIKGGLIPEIIISNHFILHLVSKTRDSGELYINHIVREIYSRSRRVKCSITSLVPQDYFRVLREDFDNEFKKGSGPETKYLKWINPGYFNKEITYTVTLTDRITGTGVSVSGDSLSEIKDKATKKLQIIIAENPDLLRIYEAYIDSKHARESLKPEKISLTEDQSWMTEFPLSGNPTND